MNQPPNAALADGATYATNALEVDNAQIHDFRFFFGALVVAMCLKR